MSEPNTVDGFKRIPDIESKFEEIGLAPGQVMALVPKPAYLVAYEEALKNAIEHLDNRKKDLPKDVRAVCHCACTCAFMESEMMVPVKDLLRLAENSRVSFDFHFSGLPSLVYVGVPTFQAALHGHETSPEWTRCFKLVADRVPLGDDLKESIGQLMSYAAEHYENFSVSLSGSKPDVPMSNILVNRVIEVHDGDKEAAFKFIADISKKSNFKFIDGASKP